MTDPIHAGISTVSPDADAIPTVSGDQTLALLRHGYGYLGHRMRQLGTSGFQGRLFGRRTVFLRGVEGARLFYDTEKMRRAGAVPSLVRLTLFGKRTVHALDGDEHRHRKAVFHELTAGGRITELARLTDEYWRRAIDGWTRRGEVRLFDEAVAVLGGAVCRWAGVGGRPPRSLLADLATMVDEFGAAGLGQLRGRLARRRANRWAARHIEAVRSGRERPPEGSALRVIADHRDFQGRSLSTRTAAEEFLNVLRPTVAIAWFVCFAAHATHTRPQWRHRLADGDDATVKAFVDELRRYYPFAPVLAARVRNDFGWRGHDFPAGRQVILDLYGTNHDPDHWRDPARFDPLRFLEAPAGLFDYVPHGGGDSFAGHRCPGEDLTTALLMRAVRHLSDIDYHVTERDLEISCSRFPPHFRNGFAVTNVVTVGTTVSRTGIG